MLILRASPSWSAGALLSPLDAALEEDNVSSMDLFAYFEEDFPSVRSLTSVRLLFMPVCGEMEQAEAFSAVPGFGKSSASGNQEQDVNWSWRRMIGRMSGVAMSMNTAKLIGWLTIVLRSQRSELKNKRDLARDIHRLSSIGFVLVCSNGGGEVVGGWPGCKAKELV